MKHTSQECLEEPVKQTAVESGALPPLAVDLDKTLVRTDLLLESVVALFRENLFFLLIFPWWLAHGKARFKREVSNRVTLEFATLPWRTEFVEHLRQLRAEGRMLVLATANDSRVAAAVTEYLKLFDVVLASDGYTNLRGDAKRELLVRRFGEKGFDYAADGGGIAHRDLAIWASARKAILVGASPDLQQATAKVTAVDRVFAAPPGKPLLNFLQELRPAHWLKNLLVFVPLLAAHRLTGLRTIEDVLLAFLALACCASAGYLLNDLLDLPADRRHIQKRFRPFAAGDLSLSWAMIGIPAFLLVGGILAMLVSPLLLAVNLGYFTMSALYSAHIKKIVILDVLFLAGLYTVRILSGSAATGIWPSEWLLAFSTFLFFSLAMVKRYGELMLTKQMDGTRARARAYELSDAELLASMGTASGYISVLVLALYISTDKARAFYSARNLLWLLCPLLFYWISYVWLTAHRGRLSGDLVVFATEDWISRILIVLMTATAILAL
jgi:4-hydroxybenzoate polyprenyltransferase